MKIWPIESYRKSGASQNCMIERVVWLIKAARIYQLLRRRSLRSIVVYKNTLLSCNDCFSHFCRPTEKRRFIALTVHRDCDDIRYVPLTAFINSTSSVHVYFPRHLDILSNRRCCQQQVFTACWSSLRNVVVRRRKKQWVIWQDSLETLLDEDKLIHLGQLN